jgi:hypothetical protein
MIDTGRPKDERQGDRLLRKRLPFELLPEIIRASAGTASHYE